MHKQVKSKLDKVNCNFILSYKVKIGKSELRRYEQIMIFVNVLQLKLLEAMNEINYLN